jgi:predicted GNAT family N-acyltransferase
MNDWIARNQAVRENDGTERRKKDFIGRHKRNWENKHPSPLTFEKRRLLPDGHIGRMAVLKSARGTGVGAKVLDALTAQAGRLGYTELVLSAQTHAAPFYARAGFEPVGDEFEEAGIPHVEMRKRLG